MPIALAMDLGGSHASLGVAQGSHLLASRDVPLEATGGLEPLLPRLRDAMLALLSEVGVQPGSCMGLALSLPSLVDFRARRIASANDKFPDAPSLDLQAWTRAAFGLPLAIENDARAALLGEATAGAARGCADVVMMTLGTGVGCAVLAGGELFRTAQPQGGNLGGHIPVRLNGRRCTCGARGCMESEASGWALPLVAREMPGFETSSLAQAGLLDFATLFRHSDAGDPVAAQVLQHCIHVWSVGAVGLVHAYGPQRLLFGGGVLARAADVLPAVEGYVRQHAWAPAGPVEIFSAELGNRAPLYAAVPLLEDLLRRP